MISTQKLIVVVLLALFFVGPASGEVQSRFVRNDHSDTVIVFVHGVLGDAAATWSNGSTYWPDLLTTDHTFDGADIFALSYPTSLWATMDIDELADYVRVILSGFDVTSRSKLIFVAHSMGGLVLRDYLLKYRDIASRTKFVYFFSTPTEGAQIATFAKLISDAPQLRGMQPIKSTDALASSLRTWIDARLRIPTYCAYEKQSTFGVPIVSFASASNLCTETIVPIDADHINIVKPSSKTSIPYMAFKAAYVEQMNVSNRLDRDKLKAFGQRLQDLNLTLIQNREQLLPQIDDYIAAPSEEKWNRVRETATTMLTQIRSAVQRSMEFDAQFFDVGNKIVVLTVDARNETVGRQFLNTFTVARGIHESRAVDLEAIQRQQRRPTAAQAIDWRDELKAKYDELSQEVRRLIELVQSRS
jgi:pimeloyl-ACP methyl ester carboxylesterase